MCPALCVEPGVDMLFVNPKSVAMPAAYQLNFTAHGDNLKLACGKQEPYRGFECLEYKLPVNTYPELQLNCDNAKLYLNSISWQRLRLIINGHQNQIFFSSCQVQELEILSHGLTKLEFDKACLVQKVEAELMSTLLVGLAVCGAASNRVVANKGSVVSLSIARSDNRRNFRFCRDENSQISVKYKEQGQRDVEDYQELWTFSQGLEGIAIVDFVHTEDSDEGCLVCGAAATEQFSCGHSCFCEVHVENFNLHGDFRCPLCRQTIK